MSDDNVSIAAIVVALVALIVALGQLFGQYFATADGYRRCQPSVMGRWAKFTRLRWRWSQFRFETLYTTPEISFVDRSMEGIIDDKVHNCVQRPDLFQMPEKHNMSDESVCWLLLLDSLRIRSSIWERKQSKPTSLEDLGVMVPAVRLCERSWDFMPPDLVRPVATTNVFNIAIMAYRLGMTWIDFRPEENVMRAEGNGQLLNSTHVRSIGIILQYLKTGGYIEDSIDKNFNPSRVADALSFGIILTSTPVLHMYFTLSSGDHLKIGTIDEILFSMAQIGCTKDAIKKAKDTYSVGKKPFGFSDIIPLITPMMHVKGNPLIRLPVPAEHCDGLTSHKEGFVVFFKRLNEHVNERSERASEMILWVQRQYEKLRVKYEEWENETLASSLGNTQNPDFLDAVHDCYDYTSLYFKRLHQRQRHFRIYPRLVFLHINHAVYYWGDATKNIREGNARKAPPDMQDWLVEGAHLYWDYLPSIAKALMNECNRLSEDRVYEAWIMMMFRAFCWWRCHWMDLSETMENSGKPKTRLPSRYYNSKFPVYIG